MIKIKRVKQYVLQGFWADEWHDIQTFNSWTTKDAQRFMFFETDYPKRIIQKIVRVVKF